MQYPLDLGSNELGHYILFESGFVGYSPQTSTFRTSAETVTGWVVDIEEKEKDYSKSTESFYYNIWYSIVYANLLK